jgi:hypothetical protein
MSEKALRLVVALVGACFVGAVSEFFPVPGMLAAALVFPQGVHSDHATAYLVLAICLNFAMFFAATYFVIRFFTAKS